MAEIEGEDAVDCMKCSEELTLLGRSRILVGKALPLARMGSESEGLST